MSAAGAGLTEQEYHLQRQGGHPWEVGHAPVRPFNHPSSALERWPSHRSKASQAAPEVIKPPAVRNGRLSVKTIDDDRSLLLFTPEYNHGIPGVFKNAIDWLSRPASDIDRVFGGRPVAILGASPGPFGTVMSQAAWLPVLHTLGAAPWFGARLLIPHAGAAFDAEGQLIDENASRRLGIFISGFAEHCRMTVR
jgi:hypothetical protein